MAAEKPAARATPYSGKSAARPIVGRLVSARERRVILEDTRRQVREEIERVLPAIVKRRILRRLEHA
jgi:hypothetical protein